MTCTIINYQLFHSTLKIITRATLLKHHYYILTAHASSLLRALSATSSIATTMQRDELRTTINYQLPSYMLKNYHVIAH